MEENGDRYNPAYAGTTVSSGYQCLSSAIQPRVCGDYGYIPSETEVNDDTTPRMRGLRVVCLRRDSERGYNPAYAGTTTTARTSPAGEMIQPRVCGDYNPPAAPRRLPRDTTPRMRGLRY